MEKKVIKRSDWVSNFNLIGKPIINDFTFKLNEKSEKSNWVYNALNLGVDCGEAHGTVYAELMSGYSEENENRIYAHGKKDDGSDDFEKQIIVDWEDRFNEDVLEEIFGEVQDEFDEEEKYVKKLEENKISKYKATNKSGKSKPNSRKRRGKYIFKNNRKNFIPHICIYD